jgi:hypothetical protein
MWSIPTKRRKRRLKPSGGICSTLLSAMSPHALDANRAGASLRSVCLDEYVT